MKKKIVFNPKMVTRFPKLYKIANLVKLNPLKKVINEIISIKSPLFYFKKNLIH